MARCCKCHLRQTKKICSLIALPLSGFRNCFPSSSVSGSCWWLRIDDSQRPSGQVSVPIIRQDVVRRYVLTLESFNKVVASAGTSIEGTRCICYVTGTKST